MCRGLLEEAMMRAATSGAIERPRECNKDCEEECRCDAICDNIAKW